MRHQCRAMLLLAAGAMLAAGQSALMANTSVACSGPDEVELCLKADAGLRDFIARCASKEKLTNATGVVSVTGAVTGRAPFVETPDGSGFVVCADGVAKLHALVEATASAKWAVVTLEQTVLDVQLQVSKDAATGALELLWSGTLLSGEVQVGGGANPNDTSAVSVGFTVRKADTAAAVTTQVYVDISELSTDVELMLPSRMEYEEAGLPFFGERPSTTGHDSCAFTALLTKPVLGVPGINAALRATEAEIDVCAFAADTTDPVQFLRIGAELVSKKGPGGALVSLHGLSLTGVAVEVRAAHTSGSAVQWGGTLTATTQLFGTVAAQASADFTLYELEALRVAVAVEQPAFSLGGSVSFVTKSCSSGNAGEVVLHVPSVGNLNAVGRIAQKDGCGANGAPEWVVSVATAQPLDIAGVTVSDVAAELATAVAADNTTSWVGSVRGTVSFGENNTGSASITYDSKTGAITAFHASGTMKVGPVRGSVSVDVADNVMRGTGSFSFEGEGTSSLPTFEASVAHVATYTPDNSHLPLWSINGSLTGLHLSSFTLEEVAVSLEGRLRTDDKHDDAKAVKTDDDDDDNDDAVGVAWSGTIGGRVTAGPAKMALEATIEKNKFTQLEGDVVVSTSGVEFVGHAEVVVGSKPSCPTVRASGNLELLATQHKFNGSLLYSRCASAPGEVQFAVQATAENLRFKGLTLTAATGELKATVQDSGELDWSGEVEASANVFGGSSHARVRFGQGALQEVELSTLFMTSNGMLKAEMDLHYVNDCAMSSTGSVDVTLRLEGADALQFTGDVEYNMCTGAMSLHGSMQNTWNGPGSVLLKELTIELSSEGRAADETLSSRSWKGRIAAVTLANIAVSVDFSTSTNGTSVSGTLTYTDEHVMATATIGSDCRGEGMLALTDLPHNIPSFELGVRFQKSCGKDATRAWQLEGHLSNLAIPFFGKVLRIDHAGVEVTSDDEGKKMVRVGGLFMNVFELELSFPVPLKVSQVRLRGTLRRGGTSNADSFLSAWQGGGEGFDSSLGEASPALLQGMQGMALHSVSLEIVFSGQVTLTAAGELFGIRFDAAIGVARNANGWGFGLAITAYGKSLQTPDGMPPLIANVLKTLSPSYVRLSVSTARKLTLAGVELRRGLALEAFLGVNSGPVQSVKAVAPRPFRERIEAAEQDSSSVSAGLTVVANIVSVKQINVYVILAGNIPLGTPRVALREVALAFILKLTGPPIFGFNIVMDFTFGSGATEQTFTAGGFVGVSAAGSIEVGLSLDSPQPWNRPFGIPGVKVLFPLGVKAGLAPVPGPPFIRPTLFALFGGLQIGGVSGKVAIGVNLEDFTKNALEVEVKGIDFKGMLESVARCTDCLGPVAGVMADVSLGLARLSLNPDPVSPVTITIAAASVTIPPGIRAEVRDLNLWGVIRVPLAKFELSARGIVAHLELGKMDWGPIKITSTDGERGPLMSLALTTDEQHLKIDGRTEILGQYVELRLELSDKAIEGHFTLKIGSALYIDVRMETEGKPLRPGFKNVISGSFKVDIIAQIIDYTLKFLFALRDKAQRAFEVADEKLDSARAKLYEALDKLDSVERAAHRRIEGARGGLSGAERKANEKKASCENHGRQCRRGKFWRCPAVPVCWGVYGVLKLAVKAAHGVLDLAKKAVSGGISLAKGGVNAARSILAGAQRVLSAARGVVDTFVDIAAKVGGVLRNVLRIHSLTFRNQLTNTAIDASLSGDVTLFGKRTQFNFEARIEFANVAKAIYGMFRTAARKLFSVRIPGL